MKSIAVVPMDIHKRFTKAVGMCEDGEVLETWRVDHKDRGEMERFFETFDPGTEVVMEATFNWPWIADLALKVGLKPHLTHSSRAREMAKGMSKSDRKDAIWLGKLWLSGPIFPESYMAPPEVRHMRARFRTRGLLVRLRISLKNSIHGLLHKYGYLIDEFSDLFGKKGRRAMTEVVTDPRASEELIWKLKALEDLEGHIRSIEKVIAAELEEDPRAALLRSLPGVGEITAYALLAEIGEVCRFPNGRALAAYSGVLPLSNESGGKDFGRHTSSRCNQHLKLSLCEAVNSAIRVSPRMKSIHSRVKARNVSRPGKARLAVARELAELAYLLLTREVSYQENPAPRPGSRDSFRSNRASQAVPYARSAGKS